MFRPLAWTKTLAVGSSSILAITLVPVLMVMFIRGRLQTERANPISRITQAIYLLILRFCLRQVANAFGAVGRSGSATDNAPLDMYDTTVMLKPREQWLAGMTYGKLIQQMDQKLQFPGLSNTWTMPVENRLDMELTGIKTPLGMKVQGPNVDGIQQLASQIQNVLSGLPEMRSVFAEKVAQGFYVNVDINRAEVARYGLTIADVQTAVASGIGGENIAENIEGRERYPINARYQRDFRDNADRMRGVLIGTPSGAQIPLGQVARISFTQGSSRSCSWSRSCASRSRRLRWTRPR
jgi:Cu(I)/Ag(I) efflux system membrane protein CusA/SilA